MQSLVILIALWSAATPDYKCMPWVSPRDSVWICAGDSVRLHTSWDVLACGSIRWLFNGVEIPEAHDKTELWVSEPGVYSAEYWYYVDPNLRTAMVFIKPGLPPADLVLSGDSLTVGGSWHQYQWMVNDSVLPPSSSRSQFAVAGWTYRVRARNFLECWTPWNQPITPSDSVSNFHPNPGDGHLIVRLNVEAPVELNVFNPTGLTYAHMLPAGYGIRSVDVSHLQPGVYVFIVRREDYILSSQRVVILP